MVSFHSEQPLVVNVCDNVRGGLDSRACVTVLDRVGTKSASSDGVTLLHHRWANIPG